MTNTTVTMQALVAGTGVSVRTLRHWIRQGVLPKPLGRGRGARYDERHWVRAQVAEQLRKKRMSLRDVRRRMDGLTMEQLAALVPPPVRAATAEGVPVPPSAPTYPSVRLEEIVLMDGVKLTVDLSRGELPRRIAAEIYRHYGMAR